MNITIPKKTLCTVRTFPFKNKACNSICKLLSTIYEHNIDKQELNGILNIVSGEKYKFLSVWQYVTYVINFKTFYTLLNSLNDTSKGIFFQFRTDFLC